MDKDRQGWWQVGAYAQWMCPECEKLSLVQDWDEVEDFGEDCTRHNSRRCPRCQAVFDYLWGPGRIERATAAYRPLPPSWGPGLGYDG